MTFHFLDFYLGESADLQADHFLGKPPLTPIMRMVHNSLHFFQIFDDIDISKAGRILAIG